MPDSVLRPQGRLTCAAGPLEVIWAVRSPGGVASLTSELYALDPDQPNNDPASPVGRQHPGDGQGQGRLDVDALTAAGSARLRIVARTSTGRFPPGTTVAPRLTIGSRRGPQHQIVLTSQDVTELTHLDLLTLTVLPDGQWQLQADRGEVFGGLSKLARDRAIGSHPELNGDVAVRLCQ